MNLAQINSALDNIANLRLAEAWDASSSPIEKFLFAQDIIDDNRDDLGWTPTRPLTLGRKTPSLTAAYEAQMNWTDRMVGKLEARFIELLK